MTTPTSDIAARLVKLTDTRTGQPRTYRVRRAEVHVGGDPRRCDVVLDDSAAARHLTLKFNATGHCFVVRGEAPFEIDGVVVRRPAVPLALGQALTIGPYRLEIATVGVDAPVSEDEARAESTQAYRETVRRELVRRLDLRRRNITETDDESLRDEVALILHDIISEPDTRLPDGVDGSTFVTELADECLGLGPIEALLRDREISEIMVVDAQHIYVERAGELTLVADKRFTSDEALEIIIQRIVRPLGRRIDQAVPMVDARLRDGSRVNAVIPPLAVRGPCLTIRKFPSDPLGVDDLIAYDSLTRRMSRFLERSVKARQNILISGGTGSGKTTLLNIMSSYIWPTERIVTVEDAAELQLQQEHVVALETRPPSLEGKGAYTIRDLVRNALRMRPDRIIVGECRGSEALDMLQAMNTGHAGSMTTVHSNSPRDSLSRLETLVLLADKGLSSRAVREQIVQSIGLVVQQCRLQGGARKITHISEVVGLDSHGDFIVEDIFRFVIDGIDAMGRVRGAFKLTGHLPSFLGDMVTLGLVEDKEYI